MAEDKRFHILQLRSILLSSIGHPHLCRLLSTFVADRDFRNRRNEDFHTSTNSNIPLSQYFTNLPNEIQEIFGRKPSHRNQHILYRNPSTKDIKIKIKIEQFDIPSLIMILTQNNYFQGISRDLREALNCIKNFHKLSLVTS